MQAKHVDGERVVALISALSMTDWPGHPLVNGGATTPRADLDAPRWVMIDEVAAEMPEVPRKVLVAKLHALHRQGRIGGCLCGCRGDLTVDL